MEKLIYVKFTTSKCIYIYILIDLAEGAMQQSRNTLASAAAAAAHTHADI